MGVEYVLQLAVQPLLKAERHVAVYPPTDSLHLTDPVGVSTL